MLQRICGNGFETIIAGAEQISLGKANAALCGVLKTHRTPTVCFGNRMGYPLGKLNLKICWEVLNDTAAVPMGCTAENVAQNITSQKEDANVFAKLSIDRYVATKERGFLMMKS